MTSQMLAMLMSRSTSQALIAVCTAATAIGGPIVSWKFRKRLQDIRVIVNGRMERLEAALGDARELLRQHGIEAPPTAPSPAAPPPPDA